MALLDGKVAIITGAAGLIGSDTAELLAENGARVVLADLPGERLDQVTEDLKGKGHDVAACTTDITDESQVKALVQFAVDTYGGLHILDNNAGATGQTETDKDVVSLERKTWDYALGINALGPLLAAQSAIPVMIQGGGGVIVNISSGQSLSGDLSNTAYSAGKAAVNSLTRDIAVQYGPQGIRCNAIAPGLIVHPAALEHFPAEFRALFEDNCSVQRLGQARDISNAVLYLASDLSSYVTGQIISVDGGILAHLPTTAPMRQMLMSWVAADKNPE